MKKILILVLICLIGVSFNVFSQPDEMKVIHKYIEKLNLTEAQKTDVEKIRFEMQKQIIVQRAKLATARVELRQTLKADVPDKAAIEKKMNEIADLSVQMHMIKINSWFTVNKLLTTDQQKIWKKVLEKGSVMKRQMMRRMGKRHSPPAESEDFKSE